MSLSEENMRGLVDRAAQMLRRSYVPYSGFSVGAALLCSDGSIYTGCNIENASFSPTICAERTAIFKAVSEGCSEFEAIAIVGGRNRRIGDFCPPCGVCRQVMMEFCDPERFQIVLANDEGKIRCLTLGELFPEGFHQDNLLK